MMPKNLFMIWIGDEVPKYAERSYEAYLKMNPDFNITFLKYSIKQLETILDRDPADVYEECFKNTILECLNSQKNDIDYYKKMRFIQYVADKFRFKLLNELGGIYVDCDTWPIKPFDDALLEEGFCASQIDYCKNFRLINDIYFAGCEKGHLWQNMKSLLPFPYYYDVFASSISNDQNRKTYDDIHDRFFNCTLGFDEHYLNGRYYYIDHFYDGKWNGRWNENNISVPKCKFDN